MGPDTLNRAIPSYLDMKLVRSKRNLMEDMPHFTVHDLRRTCRTLLAKQGTPGHVAERCLNHKLNGVEGIYDQYDYLEERREALNKLAVTVKTII